MPMSNFLPPHAETLVDLLEARAAERDAYLQLDDNLEVRERVSFAELRDAARGIGAHLRCRFARRDRIVLLLPENLPFIKVFFGCLYAGLVPVPTSAPDRPSGLRRLFGQLADCAPSAVVLGEQLIGQMAAHEPEMRIDVPMIPFAELTGTAGEEPVATTPDDIAFLQYTSGSTARPKGVMVTHRNLLSNEAYIQRCFGHDESTVFCSWLPSFHDMGLIGGILQPLYLGVPSYLLSPMQFLARPGDWLTAISRYRATTSGGPNFAYELCLRRVTDQERDRLDLSSWRVAFNGAEPVRARTMRAFAERFGPSGFRDEAFYPCYGLAEATLFVTGAKAGGGAVCRSFLTEHLRENRAEVAVEASTGASVELSSSGRIDPDAPVVITDPASGAVLGPGQVGEINVAGAGVTEGYWQRPAESAETFRRDVGGCAGQVFVRTGDLGVVHDGELFVTERAKDVIIIRGRNHYPQDIEAAVAECGLPLRTGSIIATSIRDGGRDVEVVVLAEVRGGAEPAEPEARWLRGQVVDAVGVAVGTVAFVRSGAIPRTTSGKLQRSLARDDFLAGRMPVIHVSSRNETDPTGPAPMSVPELLGGVLGVHADEVLPDEPLVALGVDSMRAVSLASALRDGLGLDVTPAEILSGATMRQLSERPAETTPRAVRTGDDRCSVTQHMFAVRQERFPGSGADTVCTVVEPLVRVSGTRCREVFDAIRQRHPALRTRLVARGATWHRVVDPCDRNAFRHSGVADREAALRAAEVVASLPISLTTGPLAVLELIETDDGAQFLVFAAHHAVVDFWSLTVFWREFWRLMSSGDISSLPAYSAAPDEHAAMQREVVGATFGEELRQRWLADVGAGKFARLPAPVSPGHGQLTVMFDVGTATRDAVHEFARARSTTPFCVLLAVFQYVLAAATGEGTSLVAVPFHGRTRPGWEHAIGCFVNVLPVLTSVAAATFDDLLGRVRSAVASAMAAQDFPVGAIGARLPEREGRTPLTQIGFVLQAAPDGDLAGLAPLAVPGFTGEVEHEGLRLRAHAVARTDAVTELLVSLIDDGTGLLGSVQFDAALVDEAWARQVPRLFETALRYMIAMPDTPLRAGAVLAAALDLGTREFGQGDQVEVVEDCLSALLTVARRTPNAVAVEHGRRCVTYAELCGLVGSALAVLRRERVPSGEVIGVHLDPSPERLAWLYAIWAHGCVYLSLDTAAPPDRLRRMVTVAGCRTTISTAEDVGVAGVLSGAVALDADTPWPHIGDVRSLADTAYLLFTSGSTGLPKGALVTHRGLANVLMAQRSTFRLDAGDRVLAFAAMSFDAALFEVVFALGAGATLVIPTPGERAVEALGATLRKRAVSAVVLAPSVLRRVPVDDVYPQLTTVVVAGERMPPSLVADWAGRCALFNAYGPTEAAIWSSVQRLAPGAEPAIGRPIQNVGLSVVDDQLDILPPGCVGEIVIAGAGTGVGYVGEPELTEAAFGDVAHLGGWCYRSGDVGRWRSDGVLEFLGRADRQVKIRGVRVEPAEIETRLLQDTAVDSAVVVPTDGPEIELIAFVVLRDESSGVDDVRRGLRTTLPDAMVPARIIGRPTLPVDAHGKVDRAELLRSLDSDDHQAIGTVDWSTDAERRVAAVCARELGVSEIRPGDDLFALGANSLNVVGVAAALGVPVAEVHAHRTVSGLTRLRAMMTVADDGAEVDTSAGVPLSALQRDIYLADRLTPGSRAYHVPLLVRIRGVLDRETLARALAAVVAHHPNLRARLRSDSGSEPVVVHDATGELRFLEVDEHTAVDGHQRDVTTPFDLTAEPPLRAALYRVGPDEHLLSLVAHHLFVDGWSMRVLLEDLSSAYRGHRAGRDVVLPAAGGPPVVRAGDTRAQYWQRMLRPAPTRLRWSRAGAGSAAALAEAELPEGLARALRRLADEERISVFSVGLAAYFCLLSHHSGQAEVTTATVSANRDSTSGRHVGFLAATLPLRLRLAESMTFRELARVVWTRLGEAQTHQGLALSEMARLSAAGPASALFQTMFVQVDESFLAPRLDGVVVESVRTSPPDPKCDLTLTFGVTSEGARCVLEFDTATFDPGRGRAMLDHFVSLLESFADNPDLGVRHFSDGGFGGGHGSDSVTAPSALELLAARQTEDPDAVALVADGVVVTRDRFHRAVNVVAEELLDSGITSGDELGVEGLTPIATATALFAVWRAGGTVVLPGDDIGVRRVTEEQVSRGYAVSDGNLERAPLPAQDRVACRVITSEGPVSVSHAEVAAHLAALRQVADLSTEDSFRRVGGCTYAALLLELVWPLAAGAVVRSLPPGGYACVTAAHLEPAELARDQVPSGVRIFTSELVSPWLAAGVAERTGYGVVQLWGPGGVPIVHHTWSSGASGAIVLGRPFAGARPGVVGELNQELPPLATGRLWTGGARPSTVLVRRRWDGLLEYRGDVATAEALGFDPEEIGLALREICRPLDYRVGVTAGGVVVAAFVPAAAQHAGASDLATRLAGRLPVEMRPQHVVQVDRLPADLDGLVASSTTDEIRKTVEFTMLREIWSDVLGIDDVRTDVSFFQAGGHSVLVLALQRLVRERFGTHVPIALFFQHVTVEEFSRHVLRQERVVAMPATAPDRRRLAGLMARRRVQDSSGS